MTAQLAILDALFKEMQPLSELTLSSFRLRWTAVAAGRALLLRLDDEDKDEYMQDMYRHITDMFLVPQDVGVRVWLIYTLYTLHECQCATDFAQLPFPDALCVLRRMLEREMFEFAVEYAPPSSNTSIDFSNRYARAVRDEPAPNRLDQSGAERRAKQRRLLLESGPAAHVHELGDLGSVLQLDKLRQLSSAYAQAMHACHSGADSHAAAAAAAASPTATASAAVAAAAASGEYKEADRASAAAAAGSSYGTAVNIATAAAPPGSSSAGAAASATASATLPPASLRLLHRVETAVEEQRVLREQLLRGQPPPPLMPAVSAVTRARGSVAGAAANSLLPSLSPAVFAQLQQQMRSAALPSTPTAPSSAMSRSATGSAPPPPVAAAPMHFSLQAIHAAATAATLAPDPAAHRP